MIARDRKQLAMAMARRRDGTLSDAQSRVRVLDIIDEIHRKVLLLTGDDKWKY
jgi:hypothetical protein